MYCYSAYLKVEDGNLYGRKHFWSRWVLINPSDITNVKEYGFINPYIKIWTLKGNFFIGALRKQYAAVTEFLKENTQFDLTGKMVHEINVDLFRKEK